MKNKATTQFWRKMYYDLANAVEQVLGKALGYPMYSSDQKNFPGTTDKDGVCVGEHVPESLLDEAAGKLKPKYEWKFDWSPKTWPQYDWQYSAPIFNNTYTVKPLVFDKAAETPCTAEIEVAFEKLASYFEKRSKENSRRAEKEEKKVEAQQGKKLEDWSCHEEVGADRSGYYFSGKADSYKRAAEKVREILGK